MTSDFSIELPQPDDKYKWYILAISLVTGTFVSAIPFSCMPVLFKEISEDLGLDLVQIGTIWGVASLAGIFISIGAGLLSDRFGVKNILSIFCILVGITGALRGLSNSFFVLAFTVFLNGIVRLIIPITVTKTIGLWFRGKNLGMAMGVGAVGMGLGLMLGPMISATVMSPALGGWRNVMYFYGGLSAAVGILWIAFGREPSQTSSTTTSGTVPLRQALSKLIRLKSLWFLGLTLLFRVGCLMGMTGYLPLYLRDQRGWEIAAADGTLAAFYAISTVCVVPLSILSDKIGSRKLILYIALIVGLVCVSLIPIVEDGMIWVLILLAGVFMDGFMSLTTTILLETEGVGVKYSGTALGIVFTIVHIGSVSSPPLGNSLERIGQQAPFFFWASLSIAALVMLAFVRETGWRRTIRTASA
ncbi:MAG TPA: MFS transporter [Dehalococcoidia bacterium]|nr:MFS transporter [Dehalococcoidia bacterium]